MTISILCPTRRRPAEFRRMVDSARATASAPVEIVARYDDDDLASRDAVADLACVSLVGPRILLAHYWNECFAASSGRIVMHGNDDLVFRTPGWDTLVESAFARYPDRIAFVHGSDEGQHFDRFGSLGFVSREWVAAVGYFIPPYFAGDCTDDWLNELANAIDRRVYVSIVTEHLHPMFGKAPDDATYSERRARDAYHDPRSLYHQLADTRARDIEKLRRALAR